MLRRVLRVLARVVLVFVVVWLVVIGYWQYTRRVVSSSDLIVYLGLLPIGLLLAYVLVKGGIALGRKIGARRKQHAAAQTSAAASATPADAGASPTEKPLLILASGLASGLGDAAAWIDRTRAYEVHHALDASLSDALGWPVRSMRLADLDEADALESDEALASLQPAVQRMARMLERVQADLEDVVETAARVASHASRANASVAPRVVLHPEWTGATPPTVDAEAVATEAPRSELTSLALHLLLPGFVDEAGADALMARCAAWARQTGWPEDAVTVSVTRVDRTGGVPSVLGDLIQQQSRSPARLLVLLSTLSWLDEELLADELLRNPVWAERLRKSATFVGEAAAGLVLANAPLVDTEAGAPRPVLAQVSRLAGGERQKPVDAKGTIDAELLESLSQGLVRAYGVDAAQIRRVVATGDLALGRPVELGKWLTDHLPHLSLVDDSIQVGQHLGECDPVCDLVALVLAVESVREVEAPVLCCSNHGTHWRGLSALLPVAQAA